MAELCHSSTGEMAFVLRLSTAVGEEEGDVQWSEGWLALSSRVGRLLG